MRAAALLALLPVALGSPGDRDPAYRRCVRRCIPPRGHPGASDEGLVRRECEYGCMHSVTDHRLAEGLPMLQYNGRWPFRRALGMENPASTVLAVANAVPHAWHGWKNRAGFAPPEHYMSPWLLLYPLVSIQAWAFSAWFHAFESPRTAALDYASALLLLAYASWLVLRRLLGPLPAERHRLVALAFAICAGLTLLQCARLLAGLVPHHEHMAVCAVLALLHGGAWLAWCGREWLRTTRPQARARAHVVRCLRLQAAFGLAATLEIFDFAPWHRLVDAHALWHACTVPIAHLWYRFWLEDAGLAVQASKVRRRD